MLYASSPCPYSVLQWLHSEKHILTAKVCAEAGNKKVFWYEVVASAIATKPPNVVQQTIDFVRGQQIRYWWSSKLEELCKGKAMIITLLHARSLSDVLKQE